jgi:mono/diheme cytochrome c family protein
MAFRLKSFLILCALLFPVACTKKEAKPIVPADEGRRLYAVHCTACHAADPKKDGALGPSIWGSSAELLERKLVHGDYPTGYKPKRPSRVMAVLPFLKDQIPNLHAYLNTP